MMDATITKGMRFLHRRLLDPKSLPEHKPQLCVVSAVRGGMVYYKCDYGTHDDGTPWLGSPNYFPAEQSQRWIKEFVS